MKKLTEEAYTHAVKVLKRCIHHLGVQASGDGEAYPQIWARDSMITLLGAALVQDKEIHRALKASINTLRKYSTSLGEIPNNVDTRSLKPNFQAYADAGLWFVVGSSIYCGLTQDKSFFEKTYSAITETLRWYEYQDTNQNGLIDFQEGADWEDLFSVRGEGLYVNTLYVMALNHAAYLARTHRHIADYRAYKAKEKLVRTRINKQFWSTGKNNMIKLLQTSFSTKFQSKDFTKDGKFKGEHFLPKKEILQNDFYYLSYIAFRSFGERFDSFGNMLAILSGTAGKKRAGQILHFIEKYKLADPYPIRAIYPSIQPRDPDWRSYYRYANLNLPDQYHNGGVWPFLGGWYVAVLVHQKQYDKAQRALEALARLNQKGRWGFHEWAHGRTSIPMGAQYQAWSAGMYIYAYEAVKARRLPFLL